MANTGMRFANLDETSLTKLRDMEQVMGTVILAVAPNVKFANLSEDQIRRIQELERELDVILLAYQK